MNNKNRQPAHLITQRFSFLVCVLCLLYMALQIAAGYFIFRFFALKNVESELKNLVSRVENELQYKDDKWDTSLYTSDPETPHPSGSSGFTFPLYIITSEGFVIERNSPINGFLDTSDFNHLIAFEKPQTITLLTNETWRILSKPLVNKGKAVGVIVVALYHPERFVENSVDSKLQKNIDYITSTTALSQGEIDIKNLDIRKIDYDISFEVVSKFNKVLANNGRMPTFIDKSYVLKEIQTTDKSRIIKDPVSQTSYLVVTKTISDSSKTPLGIIVTGRSISFINQIFSNYSVFFIPFIITTTIALILFLLAYTKKIIPEIVTAKKIFEAPSEIIFNKQKSLITIGDSIIEIPYSSNQYYMCQALFSNLKKRWEVDELLEKFGEQIVPENWRKIYDTMITINKKTHDILPEKLIVLRNKTYQINPSLQPLVKVT